MESGDWRMSILADSSMASSFHPGFVEECVEVVRTWRLPFHLVLCTWFLQDAIDNELYISFCKGGDIASKYDFMSSILILFF
nr:hypothetical protein [Tanacetum cinerariifolium]